MISEHSERLAMPDIHPQTPILVGVGQIIDRLGEDSYQAFSAVDLAAQATERALEDTQTDGAALRAMVDTVAGVRQSEMTIPGTTAPLGRSDNFPRSVAARLAMNPKRAILEVGGGHSPQHLVTELAADIAAGRSRVAIALGSDAISTTRWFANKETRPNFTEHVEGDLEDRGYGLAGQMSVEAANHGLTDAPSLFALFENARRARLGLSRAEYADEIGRLFAPFTQVAARNPYASNPVARSANELTTPTEANRPIAEPYLRYVVARDQVNQGAAVILTSVDAARELGIPEHTWIFIHGHATCRERPLLDHEDFGVAPAAQLATRRALDMAGLTPDDIATWDFYSCFPVPVFNAAVDGLGLSPDDPRRLTVTGGLPFFGGAGNNYSMHAIAETVQRLRQCPGSYGFVGANGGVMSKYSTAVYSTAPTEWVPDESAELQAVIDAKPAVSQVTRAEGWATVETYTVKHGRDGVRTGIVIGRLERTGERFIAQAIESDKQALAILDLEQPVGQRIWITNTGPGNRFTVSPERAAELCPARPPALRAAYEHLRVERDGHLLIVTIDRPDVKNALIPPAHEELAEVFDAYLADDDLWVAILTGAGDSFCAGNDLSYAATGGQTYLPRSGFAGLTSREGINKPVIAAVNGPAVGGGFEAVLACHLVVADETAHFALSEVKVGLIATAGGIVRLPRIIPEKVATELLVTGRTITANELATIGVVNRLASAGGAVSAARDLAEEIMRASPSSVRHTLELMNETQGISDVAEAIGKRTSVFDDLMATEDAAEGMRAFAEKRTPIWRNR
ncbi:acetyl-CoA acetyltransferase [Rhodococcus sp. NPDC057014]|uniref:acetyl-CoA acetyltransferase n=1 Tax=Rhodococcus sp. NPDC057014 TaxID=3346000 RepID=UPI003638ED3E